jgi:LmbE family N-acetylglucosaminyl deacetylase
MLRLALSAGGQPLRVLCVGAHCDDIEIGCGGTLLQLQQTSAPLTIDWAILSGTQERRSEAISSMEQFVAPRHRGSLTFGDLPDANFPADYSGAKAFFSSLRSNANPDLVFCHARDDAHQDHRIVNEMTWGAFRDHCILEYEIMKWDGDLGRPNAYVPLDPEQAEAKVALLMSAYGSQRSRDWFTPDAFRAVMRIRGLECRAPSGLAEGFVARKLLLVPQGP